MKPPVPHVSVSEQPAPHSKRGKQLGQSIFSGDTDVLVYYQTDKFMHQRQQLRRNRGV